MQTQERGKWCVRRGLDLTAAHFDTIYIYDLHIYSYIILEFKGQLTWNMIMHICFYVQALAQSLAWVARWTNPLRGPASTACPICLGLSTSKSKEKTPTHLSAPLVLHSLLTDRSTVYRWSWTYIYIKELAVLLCFWAFSSGGLGFCLWRLMSCIGLIAGCRCSFWSHLALNCGWSRWGGALCSWGSSLGFLLLVLFYTRPSVGFVIVN